MEFRKTNNYLYKGSTQSTCPVCGKLIGARIHESQNKLYFSKYCPEHGHSKALVSSDAQWSAWSRAYNKPGEKPLKIGGNVTKGCPHDCGLCQDHEQHSCFIQIEITDKCDLACPKCYMGPENKWFLPKERLSWMFDRIVDMEGNPEVVTLTGGEPTLHPDLFEIARLAVSKSIRYVFVNTNGNRIAKDIDFVKRMADENLVCYLQFDGFTSDVYTQLRGKDLLSIKMKALENLEKYKCQTFLSPVIEKGVNEDQVGEIIRLANDKKFIRGVSFLPISYVRGFSKEEKKWIQHEDNCPDPLDRITHPEMIDLIADQSQGMIQKSDFIPIPCHDPGCGSVTYLIKGDHGTIPLTQLVKVDSFLDYIKNKPRIEADDLFQVSRMELEKIWSMSAVAGSDKVLDGIRKLLTRCCATDPNVADIFEDNTTQISIHMFMDRHTWDIDRAKKCCIHFMLPSGQVIPFCQYNLFYRDKYRVTGQHQDIGSEVMLMAS